MKKKKLASEISVRITHNDAVHKLQQVVIPISKQEAEDLRKALKIVQKYKKQAFQAANVSVESWRVTLPHPHFQQ